MSYQILVSDNNVHKFTRIENTVVMTSSYLPTATYMGYLYSFLPKSVCHSFTNSADLPLIFWKNATHFNDFCHSFSLSQIEGLWKWGTSRIFRILDHTFWKLLVGKSAFCPPSMNWYDAKDNQEQSIIVWYVEAVKILAMQITTIILVTAEWIEMWQCHEIDPKRLFSIYSQAKLVWAAYHWTTLHE